MKLRINLVGINRAPPVFNSRTASKMPVKVSTNDKLDAVYDVLIDTVGTFCYILCRIFDKESPSEGKYIVRGTSQGKFHCKFKQHKFYY